LTPQSKAWDMLQDDNKINLSEAWEIWVCEAQKWFDKALKSKNIKGWERDLTSEGIEPNPGPHSFQVNCCNVQSARGAWAIIDSLYPDDEFMVLLLQETRFNQSELASFTRYANKKGFGVYHVEGAAMIDRWGASRPSGGVTILVDKRLNTAGWVAEAGTSAQVLGVWVENWFIASFYAPPPAVGARLDPAVEACELLNSIHLATGCWDVEKWLLAGDANATSDQSPLAVAYGGRTLSQGQPTRWEGQQEIDWMATNSPHDIVLAPHLLSLHASDHVPIRIELYSCKHLAPTGFLKYGPAWQVLNSVTLIAVWRGLEVGGIDFRFTWQAWHLQHWVVGRPWLALHLATSAFLLAWQVWHLVTSTLLLRGRRGTW